MKLFDFKNIPLTVIIGFNFFTLFIFFTAPLTWKTNNLLLFLFFSLVCQGVIFLGYKLGYRKYSKPKQTGRILFAMSDKLYNFILLFYAATFLVKYAYLLRFKIFDVQGMLAFLLIGFADQNVGYQLSIDASRPYTINWILYFLTSIVNQIFFIIGFMKWKELSKFKKSIFAFFIFIEIFYWMGRGTNFGVITLITTFVFSILFKMKNVKLNFKKSFLFSLFIIFLLIGSISLFSLNMNNRRGNGDLDYHQFDLGASRVNENAIAFTFVPKPLHDTYMYVVSYLAQGYYHTCLALDLDFKSTYFLGNNPAIIDLAGIFKIDVWKNTYMYRLREKGVDPLVNWHSAYTWYASDVSFLGVPFVLFLLGYVLGSSWAISLRNNDFLSKIIFIIIGNMLLYLFANNTYLNSVFYSFTFILPIWYFSRINRIKLA